jgi:Protein of unknown function (DUF2946)
MPHRFRFAAIHLALAAMLLRALLPAGWMPNPAGIGESIFIVCTMDGPVQQADQHQQGKHMPDDGQRGHEECPFAAAPHIAAPAAVALLALPSYFGRFSNPPSLTAATATASSYQPQSPRAPPLSA